MNKFKIIAILVAVVVAFAVGRYTAPEPAVQIVEDTKTHEDKTENKDIEKEKIITIIEHPDGTKETVIEEKEKDKSQTHTITDEESHKSITVIPPKMNILNISALAGTPYNEWKPVYGVHVTKNIAGPITVGVFGLTSKTVGLSVGLSF